MDETKYKLFLSPFTFSLATLSKKIKCLLHNKRGAKELLPLLLFLKIFKSIIASLSHQPIQLQKSMLLLQEYLVQHLYRHNLIHLVCTISICFL